MKNPIDWNEAIVLTQELVRTDSYALEGKRKLLQFLKTYICAASGVSAQLYDMETDAPYMVAKLPCTTGEPEFKLLLQGHLDTVSSEGMENPFTPDIQDGKLWGRGSADMKSGCAAVARVFIECAGLERRRGDIYLAYSTDEEYDAAEMVKALELGHLPKCDLAVIAEPSSDQLFAAHKGNAWVQVDFFGKSAHASAPENGVNAIYMANAFVSELTEYLKTAYVDQMDPLCGRPVMNLGVIQGGSKPNVVPPHCTIQIDKRYLPGDTIQTFLDEMEMIISRCKERDPQFKAEVSTIVDCTPLCFPTESPLFQKVKDIIDSTRETPIEVSFMPGWGEGGFIQNFGIPTFYLGPGMMEAAHAPDESVAVEQIVSAARAIYAIASGLCGE